MEYYLLPCWILLSIFFDCRLAMDIIRQTSLALQDTKGYEKPASELSATNMGEIIGASCRNKINSENAVGAQLRITAAFSKSYFLSINLTQVIEMCMKGCSTYTENSCLEVKGTSGKKLYPELSLRNHPTWPYCIFLYTKIKRQVQFLISWLLLEHTLHHSTVKLREAIVNKFQDEGAVVLRGVFSPYWIQTVQQGIKKNLENPSKYAQWLKTSESSGVYFNDYCNWRNIPEFKEYVEKSPAAQIAATLTQSKDIKFYHEHVLEKSPGTEKQTPWHQDQPYYPINGSQVCSIWMPVDSIPFESSLQLICGSHKWGRWFKPRMFATLEEYDLISASHNYESLNVDEINKYPILQWAVEPGDCVVFHMLTVHGAAGNTSTSNHRRVLATRWLGNDAHLSNRPWRVSPPLEAVFSDPSNPSLGELPLTWMK